MKKVLGTMLFIVLFFTLAGCKAGTTTAATTADASLSFTVEVYDSADAEAVPVLRAVIAGYDPESSLLDLLQERFQVYCADAEGDPDASCSYEGAYGAYLVGIAGVMADGANEYIAFYVDGTYAVSGVGTTAIGAGSVDAFRLETS
jgi:hypothetical protein